MYVKYFIIFDKIKYGFLWLDPPLDRILFICRQIQINSYPMQRLSINLDFALITMRRRGFALGRVHIFQTVCNMIFAYFE